ncbi:peroxidase [Actinorhabdospora filicis]|uniref:Peroxidase n=1 Tax=Actinorhabdospora filicis TaxID=1785913 RepID=A0A9W6SIY9_9ACTN|nr:Dyp-type peroxidase [Actinorhabdospora filicis]GLZ75521.1 peroxidase [Actinorhabdospora filicis]
MATPPVSRRALVGSLAATAALAGAGGVLIGRTTGDEPEPPPAESGTVPFHGTRQPGIDTPQQKHALFAAFDLLIADPRTGERLTPEALGKMTDELLADWSAVIAALMAGRKPPPLKGTTPEQFPDDLTAEGLPTAKLTVTVGVGPWVFQVTGRQDRRPRRLAELPSFPGDQLNPAWSGGDFLLQICADDPQVVSGAFLALRARVMGTCQLRWTQHGFLSKPADGGTSRNLLGFKDGTANPKPGDAAFDAAVWATKDEPDWFAGGSYLVFRKIRMRLPEWSLATAAEQEGSIGRKRDSGAPLTGTAEFDEPDLAAAAPAGGPVIPLDAHVRLVKGIPMFRRGYNYDYGFLTQGTLGTDDHAVGTDGHNHDKNPYDAGLLFTAYVADPKSFIDAQNRMSASDRLRDFLVNLGGAIFAVPPGAPEGGALTIG